MKKKKPIYIKIPIIGDEYYVYVCIDTKKNGFKKVSKYFEGTPTKFTIQKPYL